MSTSILWETLSWAWIASEVGILVFTRTRRSTGLVQDRGSIGILWAVIILSLTIGKWIGEVEPHTFFHGAKWVGLASIIILAAALAFRWTAILTLGKSFSANVAIRNAQTLHTTGLYRFIRHPSYTGLIFIFVAEGLRTRNWIGFAVVLIPTTAALLYRIHVEEIALRSAFGEEYAVYTRTTKRLIPGIY